MDGDPIFKVKISKNFTFLELGKLPKMENFIIDDD